MDEQSGRPMGRVSTLQWVETCHCGHGGALHDIGDMYGCSYLRVDGSFCPCLEFRSTKYPDGAR